MGKIGSSRFMMLDSLMPQDIEVKGFNDGPVTLRRSGVRVRSRSRARASVGSWVRVRGSGFDQQSLPHLPD